MPMRREAYPEDWEAISKAVRERAGWKCQTCGAPNYALIARLRKDKYQWRIVQVGEVLDDSWMKPVRVVLTVHHRGVPYPDGTPGDPHDKMDVRPENLFALCQRCHLREDIALHVSNGHRTRRARKLEAGQGEFWGPTDGRS